MILDPGILSFVAFCVIILILIMWIIYQSIFDGTEKYWHKNGRLHRDDGPAIIHPNGDKGWCKNGLLHREDGPAVEYANGRKEWYIKAVHLSRLEFDALLNNRITVEDIDLEINTEKRRLFIEYYGLERYIQDSNSEVLTQDEYGTLYKKTQKSDESIVMLKVRNSTPETDGSYRFYLSLSLKMQIFLRA